MNSPKEDYKQFDKKKTMTSKMKQQLFKKKKTSIIDNEDKKGNEENIGSNRGIESIIYNELVANPGSKSSVDVVKGRENKKRRSKKEDKDKTKIRDSKEVDTSNVIKNLGVTL